MKWGVRRSNRQLARARKERSADAAKAGEAAKKAKKSGVASLSNKELQQLNTRMNLERQYSSLNTKSDPMAQGKKFAGDLVTQVAKEQAKNYANDAISEYVKSRKG